MNNYSVNKFFGHFRQGWNIKAESKEDAWNRAEKDGVLEYQSMYREWYPKSKGYVVDLDNNKTNKPISQETYIEWLREAIELGMVVTTQEYEEALGLPFQDAW